MTLPERLRSVMTDDIVELATLFESQGHELYLVGGSVRDALLGREINDLDLTTDAPPEQIERIVQACRERGVVTLVEHSARSASSGTRSCTR